MSFKRRLLLLLQRLISLLGLARLYAALFNKHGAVILMYHSVTNAENSDFIDPSYSVDEAVFDKQMAYLARTSNVLAFSDLVEMLKQGKEIPVRSVVITFDDGYLDNLRTAAPILKKYNLPATIFLCTGNVSEAKTQWIDRLYCAYSFRQNDRLQPGNGETYDLSNSLEYTASYCSLAVKMVSLPEDQREQLLIEIEDQLEPDRQPPRLTMTWDEVNESIEHNDLIEFGVHTHNHVDLTSMEEEKITEEIVSSMSEFKRQTGGDSRFFSYPYGRNSDQVKSVLQQAGIEAAVKTQPTEVVDTQSDQYLLSRFEVTHSMADFKLWVSGAYPAMGRRLFSRVVDQT